MIGWFEAPIRLMVASSTRWSISGCCERHSQARSTLCQVVVGRLRLVCRIRETSASGLRTEAES